MDKTKVAWFNEKTGEIMTPEVRLVYPALLEARANKKYPNNPPKFSAIGLVPKDADIKTLAEAVNKIATDLYGADWKKKAADDASLAVKMPIKKTENYEKLKEYAAEYPYFINVSANADYPPSIFGPDTKPVTDAKEVYGGRWAIFAVNPWGPKPENKNINRFVSIGLQRVQLRKHDEMIATGRTNTSDGFEGVDVGGSSAGGSGSTDDLF